jgi:hypothetical protein
MHGGVALGMGATLNLSAAYLPNPRTRAKPRLGSGGKRLAIRQRWSGRCPSWASEGRLAAPPIAGVVERWRAVTRGTVEPAPQLRGRELRKDVPTTSP